MQEMQTAALLCDLYSFHGFGEGWIYFFQRTTRKLDDAAHIELDAGERLQPGGQRRKILAPDAALAVPLLVEGGVVKLRKIEQIRRCLRIARGNGSGAQKIRGRFRV